MSIYGVKKSKTIGERKILIFYTFYTTKHDLQPAVKPVFMSWQKHQHVVRLEWEVKVLCASASLLAWASEHAYKVLMFMSSVNSWTVFDRQTEAMVCSVNINISIFLTHAPIVYASENWGRTDSRNAHFGWFFKCQLWGFHPLALYGLTDIIIIIIIFNLCLCSSEERKSYTSRTAWGCANYDIIFWEKYPYKTSTKPVWKFKLVQIGLGSSPAYHDLAFSLVEPVI